MAWNSLYSPYIHINSIPKCWDFRHELLLPAIWNWLNPKLTSVTGQFLLGKGIGVIVGKTEGLGFTERGKCICHVDTWKENNEREVLRLRALGLSWLTGSLIFAVWLFPLVSSLPLPLAPGFLLHPKPDVYRVQGSYSYWGQPLCLACGDQIKYEVSESVFPYDWSLHMCRTEEKSMGQSSFSLKKHPPEVKRCHGLDRGEVMAGNKMRMDKMAIKGWL